jgi:trans-2-enoyl-CoA reductase
MNEKLTAVEWLAEQMLHPEIHNPYIEQALKMEKEQITKAAARGFLNRQEEINSLTKKFQKDNIMNEKIIDKLMTENLMLSNDNVKYRQAYMQLLKQYATYMIKKQSSLDMLSKELEIWENKVK